MIPAVLLVVTLLFGFGGLAYVDRLFCDFKVCVLLCDLGYCLCLICT